MRSTRAAVAAGLAALAFAVYIRRKRRMSSLRIGRAKACSAETTRLYDVMIVGGGPVGLVLGIYLAQLGHRIVIVECTDLERASPRAIALNGETQRLLIQKIGLGLDWAAQTENVSACKGPLGRFHMVTKFPDPQALDTDPNGPVDVSKANPIVRETSYMPGPSGHNDGTFFQPELMRRLRARAKELANLEIRLETRLTGFTEERNADGSSVAIHATLQQVTTRWEQVKGGEWISHDAADGGQDSAQYTLSSKYLVGCDGVRSKVRELIMERTSAEELDARASEGLAQFELAISEQGAGGVKGLGVTRREGRLSVDYTDVRICLDVEVLKPEIIGTKLAPHFLQTCDPDRPATIIPSSHVTTQEGTRGGRHWRFELLLMDDTVDPQELLESEDARYKILSPYVTREDVRLIRAAVYRPTAGQALKWQLGRAFLAGDSAHNTPPWLGQGLNQGFNDVWNLAWKLDVCLRGQADPRLLETYERERQPNNTRQLVASCRLGGSVRRFAELAKKTGKDVAAFKAGFDVIVDELRKHPFILFTRPLDCLMVHAVVSGGEDGGEAWATTLAPAGHGPVGTVGTSPWLGKILNQPMEVDSPQGKVPLDSLLGDGFALVTSPDCVPSAATLIKLRHLGACHYACPPEVLPQLGDLFSDGILAALVRPDHVVVGTVRSARGAEAMVNALDRLLVPPPVA